MAKDDSSAGTTSPGARPSIILAAATVAIAALVGFGAVYVMARDADNGASLANARVAQAPAATTPVVPPTAPLAAPLPSGSLPSGPGTNTLSTGQMAAFVFKKTPEAMPEFVFLDASGKQRSLKDWRGKVVLLNLWATWCIPCRKEMPGLERLQKDLGSDKFEVVAVSVDRTGIDGAKKFLDGIKVAGLGVFSDPTVRATSTLKAIGLPATLLIDREGREIGRLTGPAEWDSAEAKALITAAQR